MHIYIRTDTEIVLWDERSQRHLGARGCKAHGDLPQLRRLFNQCVVGHGQLRLACPSRFILHMATRRLLCPGHRIRDCSGAVGWQAASTPDPLPLSVAGRVRRAPWSCRAPALHWAETFPLGEPSGHTPGLTTVIVPTGQVRGPRPWKKQELAWRPRPAV